MDIAEQRHPDFRLKRREGQGFLEFAYLIDLDRRPFGLDHNKVRVATGMELATGGALVAGFVALRVLAVEGGGKGFG